MDAIGAESASAIPPDLWGALLKSAAVLCLVLGLIIVVLYLLRRFILNSGHLSQRGKIQLMASYPVGPKERIALVDVMGRKILIGITSQQISRLAHIDCEEELEDAGEPIRRENFLDRLKGAVAQRQNHQSAGLQTDRRS